MKFFKTSTINKGKSFQFPRKFLSTTKPNSKTSQTTQENQSNFIILIENTYKFRKLYINSIKNSLPYMNNVHLKDLLIESKKIIDIYRTIDILTLSLSLSIDRKESIIFYINQYKNKKKITSSIDFLIENDILPRETKEESVKFKKFLIFYMKILSFYLNHEEDLFKSYLKNSLEVIKVMIILCYLRFLIIQTDLIVFDYDQTTEEASDLYMKLLYSHFDVLESKRLDDFHEKLLQIYYFNQVIDKKNSHDDKSNYIDYITMKPYGFKNIPGNVSRISKIHKEIIGFLKEKGINYEIERIILGFVVDLLIITKKGRIILEIDGEHHYFLKKNEKVKFKFKRFVISQGFDCHYLNYSYLNNDFSGLVELKNRILEGFFI